MRDEEGLVQVVGMSYDRRYKVKCFIVLILLWILLFWVVCVCIK